MNVNSRKFSVFALISATAIGLFSFQNCAPQKNGGGFQSSTAGLDGQISPSSFSDSQKFEVGQCGPAVNLCDGGISVNEPDTDVSVWSCVGTGGGSSVRCTSNFSNDPVPGVCSSLLGKCIQGRYVDLPNLAIGQERWACEGFNGGATAECAQVPSPNMPPVNGVCGTTSAYSCNPGLVVRNVTAPPGSTAAYWTCNGINGGAPSPICQFSVANPDAPQCGTTDRSCVDSRNTVVEVDDTLTHFAWQCTKSGFPPANCLAPKPVCVVAVEPLTHYGDSYSFRVSAMSGAIPDSVTVKYHGSKTNLAGTTTETLATEVEGEPYGTSQFSIGKTNTGGSVVGIYNRWLTLESGGKEICKTNTVTYTLTPRCDLILDKNSITTADTIVATLNFAVSGQPPLAQTPYYITWYGTKNRAPDETGLTTVSISVTGNTATKTIGPFSEGTYQRYFVATANNSINSPQLCKSRPKSFTVEAVAPVNGKCSDSTHALTLDRCAVGSPVDTGTAGDSDTENIWTCKGSGTGALDDICKIAKPAAITSYCPANITTANTCANGATAVNQRYSCLTELYTWDCQVPNTSIKSSCQLSAILPICQTTEEPVGTCSIEEQVTIQLMDNTFRDVCP